MYIRNAKAPTVHVIINVMTSNIGENTISLVYSLGGSCFSLTLFLENCEKPIHFPHFLIVLLSEGS